MKRLLALLLLSGPVFGQGVPISGLPAATTPLSGSELTVVVQGGVTKNTPVNTVGSTGALATFDLRQFGGACDGVTVDDAAFAAQSAAVKAYMSTAPNSAGVKIVLCQNGNTVITKPINWAGTTLNAKPSQNLGISSGITIDGTGTMILCQTNGLPCIDAMGLRYSTIFHLTVYGSCTAGQEPSIGMRVGRINSPGSAAGSSADINNFFRPVFNGCFSFADYFDLASEDLNIIGPYMSNSDTANHATARIIVQDAHNHFCGANASINGAGVGAGDVLGAPYNYFTVTNYPACDTLMSFNETTVESGVFQVGSGQTFTNAPIYYGGSNNHHFINSYLYCGATPVNCVQFMVISGAFGNQTLPQNLTMDIHIEPVHTSTILIDTCASCNGGSILTTNTLVGGSSYTSGTYLNVPLTGGLGTTATANITTSGGAVISVAIVNEGINYHANDVLSASNSNLGGTGSGFSINAATVSTSNKTVAVHLWNIDINEHNSDANTSLFALSANVTSASFQNAHLSVAVFACPGAGGNCLGGNPTIFDNPANYGNFSGYVSVPLYANWSPPTLNSATTSGEICITYVCDAFQNPGSPLNVGIGRNGLGQNGAGVTGTGNTAVGNGASFNIAAANYTTSEGQNALKVDAAGASDSAFGTSALQQTTGASNTGLGAFAGEYISSGVQNTAGGFSAMVGLIGTPITGGNSAAYGYEAAFKCQGACAQITAVGSLAGSAVTTDTASTFIGYDAGATSTPALTDVLIIDSGANTSLAASASHTHLYSTDIKCTLTNSTALCGFSGYTQLASYTVGTLPTCNGTFKGSLMYVTDAAAAPVYNATAAGGGSVVIPVFCNGSNWVNH